jgi:hypothetical protein
MNGSSFPYANRTFDGSTPLDYVIEGGIPAMQTLSRSLDTPLSFH